MSHQIKAAAIYLFISVLLLGFTTVEPLKVYLVISSRNGDYTIEKIFLKKENAEKYCTMFKESHNYGIEERKLTE